MREWNEDSLSNYANYCKPHEIWNFFHDDTVTDDLVLASKEQSGRIFHDVYYMQNIVFIVI